MALKKGETVYELKEPVMFGDDEITEVKISRKLKFLKGCVVRVGVNEDAQSKDAATLNIDMGQLIDLASRMTGLLPAQLDELCDDDQAHLIGEANSFLFSRLGTGPSS